MGERFEQAEVEAALRLDRAVDDVAAGGAAASVDPATGLLLEQLAHAVRLQPDEALAERVRRQVARGRRTWLLVRIAAAALGALFLVQGAGNLLFGEWVARGLGVPHVPHTAFESGVVLLALGGVVLAGALARRWLGLAVAAGSPVGIALALNGLPELADFPAGGLLHLAQGLAAIVLVALWWRTRRYVPRARAKEKR